MDGCTPVKMFLRGWISPCPVPHAPCPAVDGVLILQLSLTRAAGGDAQVGSHCIWCSWCWAELLWSHTSCAPTPAPEGLSSRCQGAVSALGWVYVPHTPVGEGLPVPACLVMFHGLCVQMEQSSSPCSWGLPRAHTCAAAWLTRLRISAAPVRMCCALQQLGREMQLLDVLVGSCQLPGTQGVIPGDHSSCRDRSEL